RCSAHALPRIRPFAVIDSPMIFEKAHLEVGRNLLHAIMVHVCNQAWGMREKILGVKIENGGQPDLTFSGIKIDVSCFSDESACSFAKRRIEMGRAERDAGKPRAADHHAIEGEVAPFLAERANDVILELVERD